MTVKKFSIWGRKGRAPALVIMMSDCIAYKLYLRLQELQLEKVVPSWETSRNGNRFRILKILFKSEQGLTTMRDLLHGSKMDLLEGLSKELENVRDKIYVSLLNPHRRLATMAC